MGQYVEINKLSMWIVADSTDDKFIETPFII